MVVREIRTRIYGGELGCLWASSPSPRPAAGPLREEVVEEAGEVAVVVEEEGEGEDPVKEQMGKAGTGKEQRS